MPHLTLEYSDNFEEKVDFMALWRALNDRIASFPFFERGGIRITASACRSCAIADMASGDVVEVETDGIGTLRNTIADEVSA